MIATTRYRSPAVSRVRGMPVSRGASNPGPGRQVVRQRPQRIVRPNHAWRSARGGIASSGIAMATPILTTSAPDGLGFSLKPPKIIRKAVSAVKKAVTIKNVLKVGAVVGAAALVPGALPFIAKTAVGAAKVAVGAGRVAFKGATGLARFGARNISTAAKILVPKSTGGTVPPTVDIPPAEVPSPPLPVPPVSYPTPSDTPFPMPAPQPSGGYSPPSSDGGYYGGGVAPMPVGPVATEAGVSQAGFGQAAIPLLIGGAVLLALAGRSRVGRAS